MKVQHKNQDMKKLESEQAYSPLNFRISELP